MRGPVGFARSLPIAYMEILVVNIFDGQPEVIVLDGDDSVPLVQVDADMLDIRVPRVGHGFAAMLP